MKDGLPGPCCGYAQPSPAQPRVYAHNSHSHYGSGTNARVCLAARPPARPVSAEVLSRGNSFEVRWAGCEEGAGRVRGVPGGGGLSPSQEQSEIAARRASQLRSRRNPRRGRLRIGMSAVVRIVVKH